MRTMLESTFGASGAVVAQYVITLIVVLVLVGVVYMLIRRTARSAASHGGRARQPRLGIVDSLSIDARRRLLLVRRDNVEHLVLIGGAADLLIEASITRARPAQRPVQSAQARPMSRAPDETKAPAAPMITATLAPPSPAHRTETRDTEDPPPLSPLRAEPAEAPQLRWPRSAQMNGPESPGALSAAAASPPEPRPAVGTPENSARAEARPMPPARSRRAETFSRPRGNGAPQDAGRSVPPAGIPGIVRSSASPSGEASTHPLDVSANRSGASAAAGDPDSAGGTADTEKSPGTEPQVTDLEKEMARLLGQISTERSN